MCHSLVQHTIIQRFQFEKTMQEKLKQDHHKVAGTTKDELTQYKQGRGAQFNTKNKFLKNESTKEHVEGIDDWEETNVRTQYIEMQSKSIVNKVESKMLEWVTA
ncbi:MAG: hypothetical protein WDM71_01600 [Ferruginibacter sp.]